MSIDNVIALALGVAPLASAQTTQLAQTASEARASIAVGNWGALEANEIGDHLDL